MLNRLSKSKTQLADIPDLINAESVWTGFNTNPILLERDLTFELLFRSQILFANLVRCLHILRFWLLIFVSQRLILCRRMQLSNAD
jgi:hypothetical protein